MKKYRTLINEVFPLKPDAFAPKPPEQKLEPKPKPKPPEQFSPQFLNDPNATEREDTRGILSKLLGRSDVETISIDDLQDRMASRYMSDFSIKDLIRVKITPAEDRQNVPIVFYKPKTGEVIESMEWHPMKFIRQVLKIYDIDLGRAMSYKFSKNGKFVKFYFH